MGRRDRVSGLLLAAGAGRRMGTPKGLLRDDDGTPWVARTVATLFDGGCHGVTVVLGAAADDVAALLPHVADLVVIRAADWPQGMGASLRAGLVALSGGESDVALISLVDTPGVGAAVVSRLVAAGRSGVGVLARAAYDGVPGHPVLIGRAHWDAVFAAAQGDRGARDYLAAQPSGAVQLVECGDIGDGRDLDRPDQLEGPDQLAQPEKLAQPES